MRPFSLDRSLCSVASHCGPIRLEQIDSFAPGHQIRFGNLNYTADIRGDLIFDGFEPAPGTPDSHDEHGLDLLSDNAQDIAQAAAPTLNSEPVAPPMDGWIDPAQRPHPQR